MVASVFSKTSSLAIKVRGLEAFNVLCGGSNEVNTSTSSGTNREFRKSKTTKASSAILDKYTVQEKVVPLLKAIRTKEPAVMMAALTVFAQIGCIVDMDFFAMDCLPILWNFSLGPLLNLQQFSEFMNLLKKMSAKIEGEQIKKLKELSINSSSGFDITHSTDLKNEGSLNDLYGESKSGEGDFERLVLGKSSGPRANGSAIPQPEYFQSTQSSSHAFSWPASPQGSSMSSLLQPQPVSSTRAVASDQSLKGFAALIPSPTASSFNPLRTPLANFQQANNRLPNSLATSLMPSNNTFAWTDTLAPQNSMANSTWDNGLNQSTTTQNAFPIPPPASIPNQTTAKTGSDKYESLI